MVLRVLFVSILLGALIFIQIRENRVYFGDIYTSRYLFLATVYFFSIIYALLLQFWKNIVFQAYVQLLMDTLFITILIYITGGIESIFSFLYALSIIGGSMILYRTGGMIIASSSSILYGLLLDLHYYGILYPPGTRMNYPGTYQSDYLFFTILTNMAGFYLVGYLSSYLSTQARENRLDLEAKQEDLDKLEVLNESIINSITSGLIVLDDNYKVILFNPSAEKIFGIKADQACGFSLRDTIPPLSDYVDRNKRSAPRSSVDRSPFIDIPYESQKGTKTYLRLSISPLIYSSGEQRGQTLILQNVTQVRQIEEEMKKVEGLALAGELAAGIAHEIRNPMASISGSIEMLTEDIEKNEINSRLIDIISREIDRLKHLINDFLLFARPRRSNLKEFDLNQLVTETLELFRNSLRREKEIKTSADFYHPLIIESDPAQIKQVLWNLFLNASEAMGRGGVLRVSTDLKPGQLETGGEKARIVIRDNGEGLDEKRLANLFVPFFTTKEEGSGLGLAIVKRIVDLLQGEVFATNHPEGGTEITILLPVNARVSPGS